MNSEFAVRSVWTVLVFALVLASSFCLVIFYGSFQAPAIQTKFFEFDFAGYCFGVVAVAVSCAGVYVSILVEKPSEQLFRIVCAHLIPDPFSDPRSIEDTCKPGNKPSEERTAYVTVLYSITQLKRWQALSTDERTELTGVNGLNAEQIGIGRRFCKLQDQDDKKSVVQFAVIISLAYIAIPILYFFNHPNLVVATLFTVYILSIFEIALCAFLYWRRAGYMSDFERRMGTWKKDLRVYLAQTAVPTAEIVLSPNPQQPPPAPSGASAQTAQQKTKNNGGARGRKRAPPG